MPKFHYIIVLVIASVMACKRTPVDNSSSPKPNIESEVTLDDLNDKNVENQNELVLSENAQVVDETDEVSSKQLTTESEKAANIPEIIPSEKLQKSTLIKKPGIKFEAPTYDFGRIVQGEKIEHKFTFVNDGNEILEIKNAEASCGCTMPVYPFLGIDPGNEGNILVQFNSKGRLGSQNPTVQVYTNIRSKPFELRLSGEVITGKYSDTLSKKN